MELETLDRKLPATMNFWRRILEDRALRDLDDLAKLIIGCEIIVALDDVSLLALDHSRFIGTRYPAR